MLRTTALKKPSTAAAMPITIALPDLAKGEHYAGILLVDGKPAHHLVLIAGGTNANWNDAGAWAKRRGGELPTRKEQAILFANAAEQFRNDWYWSDEERASAAESAWGQTFSDGLQTYWPKSYKGRARAVRRVPI